MEIDESRIEYYIIGSCYSTTSLIDSSHSSIDSLTGIFSTFLEFVLYTSIQDYSRQNLENRLTHALTKVE